MTTIRLGLCALLLLAHGAGAQTIDNPNPSAVSNVDTLRRVYAQMKSRRVDLAIIGDSNARLGAVASGHENAMGRAFASHFGAYATRVDPVAAMNGWAQFTGGATSWVGPEFVVTPLPGSESRQFPATLAFPTGAAVLPAGTSLPAHYNCGIALAADCPVDITRPLRYHITLFRPASATVGQMHLSAREGFPGNLWNTFASGGTTVTTVGASAAPEWQDVHLDVPAGPKGLNGIMFCPVDSASGAGAVGPLMLTWHRVEDTSQTTGIAYSPLWAMGGRSARETLEHLQSPGVQLPMQEWFRQVTRLQNNTPMLVVHILHGGNDCFEYRPSLGPDGGLDSSTEAGHQDNILGIIALLRTWWLSAGYPRSGLFFVLGPYHPRPGDDLVLQQGFADAWRAIAADDDQVIAIDGTMCSTPEEMHARGYLLNGDDIHHLNAAGYQAWARMTLDVIRAANCPVDFNRDDAATVSDVFEFLIAWFQRNPRCDFDYNQAVDLTDVFMYLNAWFRGC